MSCDEFVYMGFNGTCPIQPGVYKDYNLTIPVPYFPVPWWLTSVSGTFKILFLYVFITTKC